MLIVEIRAWNYNPHSYATDRINRDLVFNTTLNDQEVVQSLHEQFAQLERGVDAVKSPVIFSQRYLFLFLQDGKVLQTYAVDRYTGVWEVDNGYVSGRRPQAVDTPVAILRELHDSIGLPWELPLGHR